MVSKKYALFLVGVCLFGSGCFQKPSTGADKAAIASVNNYNIMSDEFESEFAASSYGQIDTPESRQNFLNTLIDRKLILQYAQKEGLDKEKNFLKTIEKFWEQSLLKVALDKKTREIESALTASDWQAKRSEEAQKMSDWMNELRQKARITIKGSALDSVPADKKDGSR